MAVQEPAVQEPVEEIVAPVRQRVQRSAPPPPRSPSPEEEPIFEKTDNHVQRAGMMHSNCRLLGNRACKDAVLHCNVLETNWLLFSELA